MGSYIHKGLLYTSCSSGLAVGNNSNHASAIVNRSIIDEMVVIPEIINGKKVTEIGENAFSYERTIKKVIILARIKIIKSRAFFSCLNLSLITIPSTCKTIEEHALDFYDPINGRPSEIADIYFEPYSQLNSIVKNALRNKITFNLYFCTKMKDEFNYLVMDGAKYLNIYAPFEMTFNNHTTNNHYETCIFKTSYKVSCHVTRKSSYITNVFLIIAYS